MKICFLIQRFDKPSSRYRVLQFLPRLHSVGIETEVLEVSGKWWQRLAILKKAQSFPVVFVQKKLFHLFELKVLKSKGAKLIYDFDDAIMFRHKPVPGSYSWTRHREFVAMMRASDKVLAGNHYLEKKAKEYASDVFYMPTVVDLEDHSLKKSWNGNDQVTLGWLGSASTLVYLEQILPSLEELAQKYPQLQLKVVSSIFPKKAKIKMLCKQWSAEEEQADLHSFDIGLAPLQSDPWCEGKCGLKLLQYMACGLPTVSSPYGGQRDIVQDGMNGYLAQNSQEWQQKVAFLIEEPNKREAMGRKARESVEKAYSLDQISQKLIQVFNEL